MKTRKLLNTFEYLRDNVVNQSNEVSVDYIIDLKNGKWIAHQDIEEWYKEYLDLDNEVESILNKYLEKGVNDKDTDVLRKDNKLFELYKEGLIRMSEQVYIIDFEEYCLLKANEIANS